MDKAETDVKYEKLASEYSKIRSQAMVLKKAVLDEQAKNVQLNEVVKKQEQTIRKHSQEMESLLFRNEQLTKRISVLQQELQLNNNAKKNKTKQTDIPASDISVINEELEKKILQNAQLFSSLSDKEIEIDEMKQRINWFENKISDLNNQLRIKDERHKKEQELIMDKTALEKQNTKLISSSAKAQETSISNSESNTTDTHWKAEAEKWKSQCELLKSKPDSNEQLTEYYENQVKDLLEAKMLAQSEANSLWAENTTLTARLENLTIEFKNLQQQLEKSQEELTITNVNYKAQLDAMTEHLAAQNEKITKQCDEIQFLKHKLSSKK